MSKQDRQGVRTAADIERKYNFGKSFADVMEIAIDAQDAAEKANEGVDGLDKKLDHDEIFMRLTKNETLEGLYRGENGELYINGTYMKIGVIKSKDQNGVVIDLDKGVSSLARGTAASFTDLNGEDVEADIKAFIIEEASSMQNETIKDYAIKVDAAYFADGANVQIHKFTTNDSTPGISATFFWSDGKLEHWTAYDEGINAWYWVVEEGSVPAELRCEFGYPVEWYELDNIVENIASSLNVHSTKILSLKIGIGDPYGAGKLEVYRGADEDGYANFYVSLETTDGYRLHKTGIWSGVGSLNDWSPWEWENPPMKVDEEYRTTERWNGQPVYQKMVSLGALPNASVVRYNNVASFRHIVDLRLIIKTKDEIDAADRYSAFSGMSVYGSSTASIWAEAQSNLAVNTYSWDASNYIGFAMMKYVK